MNMLRATGTDTLFHMLEGSGGESGVGREAGGMATVEEGGGGVGGGGGHAGEEAGRSTSDGSDARVLVVTGRGVHSKGGGPVVKPAIESE
jgi:hypothetical protein